MQISYSAGLYRARCSFDERLAFKRAGWRWDGAAQAWVTDCPSQTLEFSPFFDGSALQATNGAGSIGRSYAVAPIDPKAHAIPCPPGLAYDDPQKVAIWEYALARTDTLEGDPPGCGKTIIGVGVSNALPAIRQTLIVCPASLVKNWIREWKKWDVKGLSIDYARRRSKQTTVIKEDGSKDTQKWSYKHFPDTDVVVISYNLVKAYHAEIVGKPWDYMICDESQYLVSLKAEWTRHVLGCGRQKAATTKTVDNGDGTKGKVKATVWKTAVPAIDAKKRLFMSGTPLLSRPVDLWSMVARCDPNGLGRNWKTFTGQYCAGHTAFGRWNTMGASNLPELQYKLRESFMIRRRKEDVLPFLPPKRRQLIPLPEEGLAKLLDREMTAYSTVRQALREFQFSTGLLTPADEPAVWEGLQKALEGRFSRYMDMDYESVAATFTSIEVAAFEELSAVRKELAAAKIPMVVEHVESLLSADEKVIVFCVHKEMARALRDQWPTCCYVTGEVPSGRRQAQIDRFMENDDCRVAVGNLVAMGVGYTMTAARYVVMAELDWVEARVAQAEDRAHRRGQHWPVLAQHLAVEGSVDFRMAETLVRKQHIAESALDIDFMEFPHV